MCVCVCVGVHVCVSAWYAEGGVWVKESIQIKVNVIVTGCVCGGGG